MMKLNRPKSSLRLQPPPSSAVLVLRLLRSQPPKVSAGCFPPPSKTQLVAQPKIWSHFSPPFPARRLCFRWDLFRRFFRRDTQHEDLSRICLCLSFSSHVPVPPGSPARFFNPTLTRCEDLRCEELSRLVELLFSDFTSISSPPPPKLGQSFPMQLPPSSAVPVSQTEPPDPKPPELDLEVAFLLSQFCSHFLQISNVKISSEPPSVLLAPPSVPFRRFNKIQSFFFSVSRTEDLYISEDSGNPKGSSYRKTSLYLGSLLRSIGSRFFSSSTRRTVIALTSFEVSSPEDLYPRSLHLLPKSSVAHRLSLCLIAFTDPVSSVASSRSTIGHVVLSPELRVEIVPVFLIGELFVAGSRCRDGPVTVCFTLTGDTAISDRHRLAPLKNQLGQIPRFWLQAEWAWASFGPLSFWGLTCHDCEFSWAWSISFLVVMGSSQDAHLVLMDLAHYVDLAHYLNSVKLKYFKKLPSSHAERLISSFSSYLERPLTLFLSILMRFLHEKSKFKSDNTIRIINNTQNEEPTTKKKNARKNDTSKDGPVESRISPEPIK